MQKNVKTENGFFSVPIHFETIQDGNPNRREHQKIISNRHCIISFFFLFLSTVVGIESFGQVTVTPVLQGVQTIITMGSNNNNVSINYNLDQSVYTFDNAGPLAWSVQSSANCNGIISNQTASSCTVTWSAAGAYGPETVKLLYTGTTASGAGVNVMVNMATFSFTIVPCGSNIISNPANGIGVGCGGSVDLTAAYTGTVNSSPAYTYQWTGSYGGNIAGATSSSLSATTSGSYGLVTTNSIGCSSTSPARTVTIKSLPTKPTLSSAATALCQGSSIVLTAGAIAAGYTYQWYTTASSIPLQQGIASTYVATTAGTYYVTVTNASTGCVSNSSSQVSLQLNTTPTAVITAVGPLTFCSGGNVVLSAPTGNGLTYVWQNGTTNVGTASSYTATTTGSYTVIVGSTTNCSAAVTSAPTIVTVNAIPAASFSNIGNTTSFCLGSSLVLNANTGTNLTYQWINNGTVLNTTPSASASYTATIGGSYSVNIIQNYSNGYTCSKTSSALNIIANDVPSATLATITPASSATLCPGGNVLLSAGKGTNLSYQWNNNGAAISGATNSSYTTTVVGNFTVTVGSTASPSCGPPVTSIPTVTTLVSPPQAMINSNGSTTICPGGSVGLNANTGTGSTYQWYNQAGIIVGATNATYTATKADNFIVKIIYNTGCSSTSAPLTLAANTVPTVSVIPSTNPVLLCNPQNSVTFTANATGLGLNYQWQSVSGGLISGATASTFTTNTPGSYQVKVFNDCGSIVSTPVNVLAPVQGQLNISIGSVAGFNAGDFASVAYGSCGIEFGAWVGIATREPPNTFTVQLSDMYGSFSNPEIIGTSYSGNPSGMIHIHIPNNHPIGDHYRIRVVSDHPAIIGNDNGVDFSIYPQNSGSLFFPFGTQAVIPGNAAYNFPGDFTIELTVKLETSSRGVRMPLLFDGVNFGNFFIEAYQCSDGSCNVIEFGGTNIDFHAEGALKLNVCSHLAIVRKSGILTIFLDGKAIGSDTYTQLLSLSRSFIIHSSLDLYGGGRHYVDELRLWNVGLLASDLINNTHTIVSKDRLGLVGYWDFNESSGQTIYDQSNTANHGILGSTSSIESTDPTRAGDLGCAPIPPIPSNGLLFNGTSSGTRATIPPNPAYNLGTGDFTLETRVILSTSQPYPATAMASNRAEISYQYSGFLFTAYQGTSLLLQLQGVNYMASIGKNINDGTCHHVAVTRLNGALQFYVDGLAIGGPIPCVASISSTATLYLGFDVLDDYSVNGNINEFRMWNINRTAAQMSANMNTVFPANTSNLIGYWRLNETSGEAILDASPTANNGYLGTNASAIDAENPGRSNHSCYSYDRIGSTGTIDSYQIAPDSSGFNNSNTVKIYPNPFTSETNIVISGNDFDPLEINIIDLQGMILYTGQITSNKAFSIGQQLSNGIYFVKVTGAGKKPQVLKIIKNQ